MCRNLVELGLHNFSSTDQWYLESLSSNGFRGDSTPYLLCLITPLTNEGTASCMRCRPNFRHVEKGRDPLTKPQGDARIQVFCQDGRKLYNTWKLATFLAFYKLHKSQQNHRNQYRFTLLPPIGMTITLRLAQ
jgi:hypothetical protein